MINWVEWVAAACGVACVYWTVRQSVLCWPAGLLQVGLYIFVFWRAQLYSDLLLHVVYVVLQVYGWHHWLHGGPTRQALRVTVLRPGVLALLVLGNIGLSVGWGLLMGAYTNAALPLPDAFILMLSLTAQVLMALKKMESWFFWIAVDLLALWVYVARGLILTTALYGLFLVMAVMGLLAWRRAFQGSVAAPIAAGGDA